MDIYNKVRDIIIDVVTKRYNQLDDKTLNLITCEQPKNFKFFGCSQVIKFNVLISS